MEIKRVGENKIRCALTENEIQEMGFDIEEIIGNSETTQKFMRVVLRLVEEQENISLEHISPMVKAELLQDHSMAITFGGESDTTFKSLMDTVNHMISQLKPDKLEEFKHMNREERQNAMDEFLENLHSLGDEDRKETEVESDTDAGTERPKKKKAAKGAMVCALRFNSMESLIGMSRISFAERMPKSSLYKLEDAYYLVVDFAGFYKDEMKPFALGAVEYDEGHFSDAAQIAYIKEHGKNIIKTEALQTLKQL